MSKVAINRKHPPVTHRDLALCFLKIALVSFGGGLSAWARQVSSRSVSGSPMKSF